MLDLGCHGPALSESFHLWDMENTQIRNLNYKFRRQSQNSYFFFSNAQEPFSLNGALHEMLNLFSVSVSHSWLSWKDSQVPAQGQLSDPPKWVPNINCLTSPCWWWIQNISAPVWDQWRGIVNHLFYLRAVKYHPYIVLSILVFALYSHCVNTHGNFGLFSKLFPDFIKK